MLYSAARAACRRASGYAGLAVLCGRCAAGICMLIDALRYLSNPEEKIARASLIANYKLQTSHERGTETGKAGGNLADWHQLLTADVATVLPAEFISRMDELRLMPLYELLEELFTLFNMGSIGKQDAYLFAFFDAVTEYLQSNSSDLDGFIRRDVLLSANPLQNYSVDNQYSTAPIS